MPHEPAGAMMSHGEWLMVALIGAYLSIAAVFAWEGNWPRVLYWFAAAQITGSVLWMR